MNTGAKQLLSFTLPFIVIIVVPALIERDISIKSIPALVTGSILICSGLTLMGITIYLFSDIGKGTLAPWNPPQKLVIRGPYKYVRNPMITGVLIVLTGEATAILSGKILLWALVFFMINNIYFIFFEEPGLEKRFGDEYREYKKNVGRWMPGRRLNKRL